jgi:ATP-dependent Clp endopeptidase proteolytic subunit ClpP
MHNFHQRLQSLISRPEGAGLRAEAPKVTGDDTTAVIRLYDSIDDWGGPFGVSAKEFADVLDDLPETVTEIRLHINSPGGFVFEAIAILNQLRNHPARVVAVVDGLAASSASFIACGVDELVMGQNSELMIHSPWALVVGDAEDMRAMATLLDSTESNIASIYARKAGGTIEEWRATMHQETWLSAEEAVEAGLADSVQGLEDDDEGGSPQNRWDLSTLFAFAGRAAAPDPKIPSGDPAGGPSDSTTNPEGGPAVEFTPEQLTDLRKRLGVADDADEATILAAVEELHVKATAEPPEPDPPKDLPEGIVAIEKAKLDELRSDAAAGREARDEQVRDRRQGLVASAVRDGRIAPARAQHWLDQLEADPGAEDVLAKLEPGLVPVDGERGSGDGDLDSEDRQIMDVLFPGEEVKV